MSLKMETNNSEPYTKEELLKDKEIDRDRLIASIDDLLKDTIEEINNDTINDK